MTDRLEERFEEWEHVVSDAIVQIGEDLIGTVESGWCPTKSYAHAELGFDLSFAVADARRAKTQRYMATVECAEVLFDGNQRKVSGDAQAQGLGDGRGDGGESMPVHVPESVEPQEQVANRDIHARRVLRSLVRLKRLDQVNRRSGNPLQLPSLLGERRGLRVERGVGGENDEGGSLGVRAGERADKVVQRGSDVVDAITGEEPQALRDGLGGFDPHEIVSAIRLVLMPYAVWARVEEGVGFLVEDLTVSPRMLKPADQQIHWATHEFTIGPS